MRTFRIELRDKAAFLNRLEKAGESLPSYNIKTNKLEGYFEVTVSDPEKVKIINIVLKQSPKINIMKTTNKSITKDQLKEMIRRELKEAYKNKRKPIKESTELDESLTDAEGIAALAIGLGGPALAIAGWFLKQLKKDSSKEGIKKAAQELSNSLGKARGDV